MEKNKGLARLAGEPFKIAEHERLRTMATYIMRMDCQDKKGIIHAMTGVLLKHGFNITQNGEFVDRERMHFFMRTEFSGDLPEKLLTDMKEALPDDANIEITEARKKEIVVLATKEPHCLGDLLIRHAFGEMNARIKAVISNQERLKQLVEGFGLPYFYVPHAGITREEHEGRISSIIDEFTPDNIVLAKYMRVFSPDFVSRYKNRIINIHHSFLPAFIGSNPYTQAYDRGVKIIGATAHFITDDLDEGPIITQDVIHIDHTYGPEEMRQAGRDVEKVVLARALKLVFENRVFINGNKTIIFD
jgi:formyltetrahydrofolate deformylase